MIVPSKVSSTRWGPASSGEPVETVTRSRSSSTVTEAGSPSIVAEWILNSAAFNTIPSIDGSGVATSTWIVTVPENVAASRSGSRWTS